MDRSLPPLPRTTFPTFSQVEQSVLDTLRRESGFACWGVARVDGDCTAVVACAGEALGLRPGVRVRLDEAPFARAFAGEGPLLVADTDTSEACRDLPPVRAGSLRALVACALRPDSVLFGLDGRPRESLAALEPLVKEAVAVLETLGKADAALSRIARAAANDIAEGQARLAARITQARRPGTHAAP